MTDVGLVWGLVMVVGVVLIMFLAGMGMLWWAVYLERQGEGHDFPMPSRKP